MSTRQTTRAKRIRRKLITAHKVQALVRILRRIDKADTLEGFVVGIGHRWVVVALISEGREPAGYDIIRLKQISKVLTVSASLGNIDQRVLHTRGQWPLHTLNVDLDSPDRLLWQLDAQFPLLSFHIEKDRPDALWVGTMCKRTAKHTWYHSLNPQAVWEGEREYFKNSRITRISVGNPHLEGLALVAGSQPCARHHRQVREWAAIP